MLKKINKKFPKIIFLLILISIILSELFFFFFYNPCITSGDGKKIQEALKRKKSKIKLCQGSVFLLNEPITFTEPFQELFTEGLPSESDKKALLKIVDNKFSIAVNAYNQNGVKIKNIKVDGNRRVLGHLKSHGLILVGGNVDSQEVDNIEAFDSRSWTTIHVNWGNLYTDEKGNKRSNCQNVKVTNNIIYSSGEEEDGKWSDGISVQCEKSFIANNTITDVTDGGIVIFGAPDSEIVNNNIKAVNKSLLVGIALVDYLDYKGNYDNVQVTGNNISSEGGYIRVGMAMGSRTWHCPDKKETILNHGAVIRNNILIGSNFGYGYVVNGVNNWTVEGNRSEAFFKGAPGHGCGFVNSSPAPFLIDKNYSQGSFQKEFKEGRAEKIHDIKP